MKSVKRLISLALSLVLVFFIFPVHKTEADAPHLVFAYNVSDDTATAVATGLNSGLNYESNKGQGWGLLAKAGLKIISDYGDQLTRCYLHHLNPGNNTMQCILGDMTYEQVMSNWNAYLQSSVVQSNLGNIVGFNLSDDWHISPGAAKQLFKDMTASLHTYAPGHKSICMLTANTNRARDPQSYSTFAAALNFSPEGCDMVGIYLYPTIHNLPVSNFSNAVKGLQLLGLNPAVTPVIGVAQSYNINGAGVENEVKYMCENGASSIGFWAYNVSFSATVAANSPDIRDGMAKGIKDCESVWGSGNVGAGGSYNFTPGNSGASGTAGTPYSFVDYPYSEDSKLPDLLPPSFVPETAPAETQVNPIFPTPAQVPSSATEACRTGDAAKNTAGLVPCGKNANDPATPWNECDECGICFFALMVQLIIEFLTKMVGIVALLAIVIGGVLYIVAAGNMALVKTAKMAIERALLGFVIVLVAWIIVDCLLTTLGYISPLEGKWHIICSSATDTVNNSANTGN